jgi:hypothetical protein
MALIGLMTDLKKAAIEAYLQATRERNVLHQRSAGRYYGARNRWDRPSRYDGEKLRALRAERGVGRRKSLAYYGGEFMDGIKFYPALRACVMGWESPNMLEWINKPRRLAR